MLRWWKLLWHLLMLISWNCWPLNSGCMLRRLIDHWRISQTIQILSTATVEVMRRTVYVLRSEQETRQHSTRGTARNCIDLWQLLFKINISLHRRRYVATVFQTINKSINDATVSMFRSQCLFVSGEEISESIVWSSWFRPCWKWRCFNS